LLEAPLNLSTDQRGFARLSGAHADIGAFELQWASTPIRIAACDATINGVVQLTLSDVPGASLTFLASTSLW